MSDSYISSLKKKQLSERMVSLGIFEDDLVEKFILGSGKGGQKLNKTSSCVYLRHKETGIDVKRQSERSRALNRFFARRDLCDKFEEQIKGEKSQRQMDEEKVRRQKRRRSRKQKEKMLESKHKQSEKKKRRSSVDEGDE